MANHPIASDGPRALIRAPEPGELPAGFPPERVGSAGASGDPWWRFSAPVGVLEAATPGEVPAVLAEADEATRAHGLWAVGFVSYEAAPAFDPALAANEPAPGVPLAWFALFRGPEPAPDGVVPAPEEALRTGRPGGDPARLSASMSDPEYLAAVAAVRDEIALGETYQANLTYRLRGALEGAGGLPATLFHRLVRSQPSPYATLLELGAGVGERAVCSASPELFFERRGHRIVCRPMKGTAPRGTTAEEDRRLAAELRASPKERAENLMIVDMVRNDLGRIARTGSVRVDRLFTVEEYPTVLQMTSEVRAESDAALVELFGALFPCASVTGAPKVRTMEILRRLEATPRGVYTGAVGWIAPGGDARFSVAIRTAWLRQGGPGARGGAAPWRLEYGTGSGVVWDSDAGRELAETRTKAEALRRALETIEVPGPAAEGSPEEEEDLRLLETLLWTPRAGYVLLERHLTRLVASARALGFRVEPDRARRALEAAAEGLPRRHHRVRLLAGRSGDLSVEALPAAATRRPWRVALAAEPVEPANPLLAHKTTRRGLYDRALAGAREDDPEVDDVLLWNERGELTESTVANLVVAPRGRGGPLLTPAARCGLLPGTFRAELLARGRVREAILMPEDLRLARRVYLVNSVRGWIPVVCRVGKKLRDPVVATHGAPWRAWTGLPRRPAESRQALEDDRSGR